MFIGTLPLPHRSQCAASVEMRGPPPAWLPPCPPDRDHDYENNYEDPEDIRERELSSRDLLLNATITATPPKYNSYETSLSQQRRTAVNEPRAPPMDEWTSLTEGQTVLHKNAEGAYYIPSGSDLMSMKGTIELVRISFEEITPYGAAFFTDVVVLRLVGTVNNRGDYRGDSLEIIKFA
ncbi:unnamed protein product [Angiostrongylus costaricensis]|uniref:Velvet domain-containing protein n=1 Tax=Angiostrongylus costaricensis TaxID=334426 RepID=A0A158PL78_ANGCS|nr:unnamed protein product [Angiostrongylus costaricensis]